MIFRIILFLPIILALSNCEGTRQNCSLFDTKSSEFRLCRADQGSKEYQFRIGMEKFVLEDYDTAINWFRKSSNDDITFLSEQFGSSNAKLQETYTRRIPSVKENGNKAASFMLARVYSEGLGVTEDPTRSDLYAIQADGYSVVIEENSKQYIIRVNKRTSLHLRKDNQDSSFVLYSFFVDKSTDGQ